MRPIAPTTGIQRCGSHHRFTRIPIKNTTNSPSITPIMRRFIGSSSYMRTVFTSTAKKIQVASPASMRVTEWS